MRVSRERQEETDFPHEHWFVGGFNGEQCVYCGQPPEAVKEKETHENSG